MKLIQLLLLILVSQVSYAQIFVNGHNINNLETGTHIQVEAQYQGLGLGSRLVVYVDHGQKFERGTNYALITNEQGTEKKVFDTPAEMLNFFLNNGWELVDFETTISERRLYTYLLKRVKQ